MCNVVFDLISLFREKFYVGGFVSTEQYYRLKNVKAESVDKVLRTFVQVHPQASSACVLAPADFFGPS